MEKFTVLMELIESAEKDAVAFYEKGKASAGSRLRLALKRCGKLASEIETEVKSRKNRK